MAGQVTCIDRDRNQGLGQFGMDQRALRELRQQAGRQIVDAIETVVFQYIQSCALAGARATADDDQAHDY